MGKFDIRKKTLCVKYDPQDRFYTSYLNLREEVKAKLNLPKQVFIRDTSLRDGEETPGVLYTLAEKLQIARMLDEIGISEIDCGFATLSKEHFEFLKAAKAAGFHMKLLAIARLDVPNPEAGIDLVIDAGADIVNTIIYGTPIPGFTSEADYINLIERSARYIKKRGAFCSFFAPITTWEFDFAEKAYSAVLKGGADRVEIAGYGLLGLTAFRLLARWLKGLAGDKQLGLHIHNNYGIATACVLAGIEEGAEVADTSVNGLSDGAGMTPLDELVMALYSLYGFDLGIKLEKIKELSELVQKLSGVKLPPYKPITGENIFIEGPDSHLHKIFTGRGKWSDNFYIKPEAVGQKLRIMFGPSTLAGRGIRAKAENMGITLSESQLQKITRVMAENFNNKTKDGFTEDEVETLIKQVN